MLIDVTVNTPPRGGALSLELDAVEGLEAVDDEDDALAAKWPMTVTWCPTCSARLTPESAISRSSFRLPDERLLLELDMLGGAPAGGLAGGLLAGGVLSAGALDVVEVVVDAAPNLTFFRTKLPAAALLAGALTSLLAAPACCRQPVALAMLAVELADACASGVVGLCAASDPHSATAVLSVTAHCH
jgi:hypothetical protein